MVDAKDLPTVNSLPKGFVYFFPNVFLLFMFPSFKFFVCTVCTACPYTLVTALKGITVSHTNALLFIVQHKTKVLSAVLKLVACMYVHIIFLFTKYLIFAMC